MEFYLQIKYMIGLLIFLQFIKINKYTLIVETITMTIFGALLLWKSYNLKILEDNSLNQN